MSVTKVSSAMQDLTDDYAFSGTVSGAGGGQVVQVVNVTSTARVAGTTTIPHDDTIPQNSEGTEMMTLAITPTNSSNILRIEAVIFLTSSAVGRYILVALFQDSTANAIAVNPATYIVTAAPIGNSSPLSHWMSAGSTSETTFKIRAGTNDSATTAMNGNAGRLYGGVCSSSITITEISA